MIHARFDKNGYEQCSSYKCLERQGECPADCSCDCHNDELSLNKKDLSEEALWAIVNATHFAVQQGWKDANE